MSWTPPPSSSPQSNKQKHHVDVDVDGSGGLGHSVPGSSPSLSPTKSPYHSKQEASSRVTSSGMKTQRESTKSRNKALASPQVFPEQTHPHPSASVGEKLSMQSPPQQRPNSAIRSPRTPSLPYKTAFNTPLVTPSPSRSPKKTWQPSALFVASSIGVVESPDTSSKNGSDHFDESSNTTDEGKIDECHATSFHFSSTDHVTLIEETMLQTRLEWNQKIISQALHPYKVLIRSLDPDNFPEEDLEQTVGSKEGTIASMEDIICGIGAQGDEFYQLPETGAARDIRGIMMKDGSLTEREVAAFFEGMRLYQTKVNSLQSQLDGLKALHRQRRTASMVFTTQNAHTSGSAFDSATVPRSSTMTPKLSLRDSCDHLNGVAGTTASTNPRPLKSKTSLRAMSIARIRSRVDAMDDSVPGQPPMIHEHVSQRDGITGRKEDIQKLLKELEEAEKYQKRLEKQLQQAGVVIAEDIPYEFAKEQVHKIANRMAEIGGSDVDDPGLREEYFRLEQDMEKYTTALQLTDEWVEEQEEMERQWEASTASENEEALRKVRRHMPVNVQNMSEAALSSKPTPNGKHLPKSLAKKFKRTNCLQLLRMDPDDIVRMHPSTLENMRVTGLTLTERRALYCHLKPVGSRWKALQSDKMAERKWNWFSMMKSNFKENVDAWQRHIDQYGPPGSHPYATKDNPNHGCPLIGKQCPLKADRLFDYSGDYGFPEEAKYHRSEIKKSEVDNLDKAKQEALEIAREKKANDRRDTLKRHYQGEIFQVTQASGSCEQMDAALDKIELLREKIVRSRLATCDVVTSLDQCCSGTKEVAAFDEAMNDMKLHIHSFAERSGIAMTGRRDTSAGKRDIRSLLEMCLCEEVLENLQSLFAEMEERMAEIRVKDGRIKSNVHQIRALMEELHAKNSEGIAKLLVSEERPSRSRKMKTREDIAAEVRTETQSSNGGLSPSSSKSCGGERKEPNENETRFTQERGNGGGRNALLDAVKARGGGRGNMGGRGGLLEAIAARGKVE